MIKELWFKKTNDFSAKPFILTLDKNVNVIIGPKGGGKSTLFDLIAGLKNNYISDSVIKALEAYNLKFEKAVKFSNEEILASQLSKKSKKEKEEDYKNRNDVIYQDDQIKKDLTSINEIEKNKFEYAKKQVNNSENVNQFVKEIKDLYQSMNNVNDYFKNDVVNINWTNTFKINDLINEDKLSLITKVDYKQVGISNLIKDEIKEFTNLETSIEEMNLKLKQFNFFDKNQILIDEEFNNKLDERVEKAIISNQEILNLLEQRKNILKKIDLMTKSFSSSYRKEMDKIKNEDYASSGLKSYEIQAKNHFKNLASDLYKVISNFEQLNSKPIVLNIENDFNQLDTLIYKIPENLLINDESKIEILKIVFHSPGSSREDVTKWLKSLTEKGIKEFKEDKIKNCIAREIVDQVKVLVDFGNEKKDYDSLSLGQRSIYGLKYKFNKSISQNLYLDQPEDNLDNNTIASEILPMIDKKKELQVIIVTHNANIGILSNPQRVIIADLNNKEQPYKIANIEDLINETSAYYLEGGREYLAQRYNKIIGNKGEK